METRGKARENSSNSILFVICMASSLVPFMGSSLNLALPYINKALSLDVVTSSWIPTSYLLVSAVFQVPCARLADMVGRKKVFICGVLLFTLFSFTSGLASSGMELIVYRCLSGVGSAMMFGTSMAILTSSVAPERRGRAFGINTACVYISLAVGPLLGGLLTQYFNWHSIFFVAGGIGLVVVTGALLIMKNEWKEETKSTFDVLGSILYAAGLFLLIYGFSELPAIRSFIMIGAGSLLLVFFSMYEKLQAYPVFNIREFLGNRVFRLSSLSALINYSSTSAIAFMLSLYLQYIRGLSPRDAGLVLISQSIVQTLATLVSGRLSDKISATFLATLGMGIIAVGLLGLCFLSETSSLLFLIALLVLLGLGFGIFSSPNTNIIMSSVEKKDYSMASATAGTMRLTGQAFSMGIAIMAMSLMMGNVPISSDVHAQLLASMRVVFIICSVLCLVGVYMSSIRGDRKV
ncbi:MFS family permease [Parabacteroides sp. PF5-5]|uniref:MFS transporter n=1 Tax=unclassified Parabacteroides TaxID=2649774 RepID=UPI0024743AFF|nr:MULTISPECIES: MFS transporter [unclassified Parabacteroides]MDH6304727.1 MFS family permease [Parabacteroides sp. PH5-39]MDH6315658.1 MFS family permease [Parabacteroides sp. PF5-13]MDH6319319.1 MFS family permease [Parabacteroides sp. PH5-13]MDH6323050.1 MFS family permease [Parabacteroides sp. PH5-8]MDH6326851.1 MFS family permease [Parabacteroides sp. PH5-41]